MITVTGDDELIRDFTNAGLTAGVKAHRWVEESGERVAERARENAPKRRPQLAPSITSEMKGPLEAEIGPENALGGGYGHIVEKGLAGRPPQPFLGPALDQTEKQIVADGVKMLGRLL